MSVIDVVAALTHPVAPISVSTRCFSCCDLLVAGGPLVLWFGNAVTSDEDGAARGLWMHGDCASNVAWGLLADALRVQVASL